MWKYFLRRTLILIPVLFGISAALFTILVMAPGLRTAPRHYG